MRSHQWISQMAPWFPSVWIRSIQAGFDVLLILWWWRSLRGRQPAYSSSAYDYPHHHFYARTSPPVRLPTATTTTALCLFCHSFPIRQCSFGTNPDAVGLTRSPGACHWWQRRGRAIRLFTAANGQLTRAVRCIEPTLGATKGAKSKLISHFACGVFRFTKRGVFLGNNKATNCLPLRPCPRLRRSVCLRCGSRRLVGWSVQCRRN